MVDNGLLFECDWKYLHISFELSPNDHSEGELITTANKILRRKINWVTRKKPETD